MYYYQCDFILADGKTQQHVSYVIKSSTYFRGKDIRDCLQFQRKYIRNIIQHDGVVVEKMTLISEAKAAGIVNRNGMSTKSIPLVELEEVA